MKVSDLLALNLCEEYNEERLIELFGTGEFTSLDIANANISAGDKVFCLFRPQFMLEQDIRRLALMFLSRATETNTEDYFQLYPRIISDDINIVMYGVYDIYKIFFKKNIPLMAQSEWLLEEIIKCLQ
jgi:hypothetical protein